MNNETHKNSTVLLGITGGIAAYKSAELVRILQKRGFDVTCVMTKHACEFIGPTTLRGLTRHPVALDDFENPSAPMKHLSLAQSCDVFAVVPATANVINKIAWGVADDLLTTTALATKAPLVIAPAMNTSMWQAKQTQDSLSILRDRGVVVVDPAAGYLACGDTGEGKLADIEVIADAIEEQIARSQDLKGKTVMVTAGPTRERIDVARFLSNDSSGRMGYALAHQAVLRGARVILISGPTSLPAPRGVEIIRVESAQEMLEAALGYAGEADVVIGAAAVADYAVQNVSTEKLKRDGSARTLELVENPDVIKTLAQALRKNGKKTYSVAFAAESSHLIENARKKLRAKDVDLVVANDISRTDIGFNSHQNAVTLVSQNYEIDLQKDTKESIAFAIITHVVSGLEED